MQCPDCGAYIGDEDKFCGECGRPAQQPPAPDTGTAPVAARQPETVVREPRPVPAPSRPAAPTASRTPVARRATGIALLVVGAVLAVCMCGLFGFILFQSNDEDTPTPQTLTEFSVTTATPIPPDSGAIPSPTPVPLIVEEAPTAVPLPTSSAPGAPTHVEQFDTDDGGWDVYDEGTTWAAYVDGGYRLGVLEANYVTWANPTWDESFANAEIEVDTRQVEGPIDNNLGLLVRYQPGDEDYYWFQISNDGYYSVSLLRGGEWQVLSEWDESSAIQTGLDVVNRIKVVCVGNQFDFYVNDTHLTSIVDDTFATGNVGLAAGTFAESGVVVEFDNLTIQELEE